MPPNPKVIGIGEVLIDFIGVEKASLDKVINFKRCFGGAPMNTIVGVARLGVEAGAIAAVGDDPFGKFIIEEFKKNSVDISQVKIKKGVRTTLAFIVNDPAKGWVCIFYRSPWLKHTSDSLLSPKDIDYDYISRARILHVSGFALSQNPGRRALFKAVRYAKKKGVGVSFDPTLRLDVWHSKTILKKMCVQMLKLADIATFSREEASFFFGTSNPKEVADKVLKYGVRIVGVKLGSKGSFIKVKNGPEVSAPAFQVNVVDVTGAGDGWNAGLLLGLCKEWSIEQCITVANAVGALVVTKPGAITALPYKEELKRFLRENGVEISV
ncbi:MAG: sugar kinase [Candidatus Brockarchaeota archaeon]|nr:sugar kinase [Candidatus Brockarchaeota archaeon]